MARQSTVAQGVSPTELRKLYRSVRRDAHASLDETLATSMAERRMLQSSQREAAAIAHAAIRRSLESDPEFRESMGSLLAASSDDLSLMEQNPAGDASPVSRDVAIGLLSGSGIRGMTNDGTFSMTLTMAKDTNVQVFVAPYNDESSTFDGGGRQHYQGQARANRKTGQFGFLYTIGNEGGSVSCGAAIWILFMRQSPGSPPGMGAPGLAQVRTYTRYDHLWGNKSYLATAHQHAGFGVFVQSWDLRGNNQRIDQNHQYWIWNDGTGWYELHTNPNYPGRDYDLALQYGTMAPYFPVEPGRFYAAAIWNFGAGDASGLSATHASFAQAMVDARATFVAVGQQ